MNPARWPTERDDGGRTVAVRFRYSDARSIDEVRQAVAKWIDNQSEADLTKDLAQHPSVDVRDQETLDVLIDSRPEAGQWKDLMVSVTQAVRTSDPGVELAGSQSYRGHNACRLARSTKCLPQTAGTGQWS